MRTRTTGSASILILLVIIILFIQPWGGVIMAQKPNKSDSLLIALNGTHQDSTRYKILFKLGLFFMNRLPDSASVFFRDAVQVADKMNDKTKKGVALREIGWDCLILGRTDTALKFFFNASNLADTTQGYKAKELLAGALSNIGTALSSKSNYPEALDYYQRSLNVFNAIHHKSGAATDLANIGILFRKEANYPQALEYYFKALKIAEELGNPLDQAHYLGSIGNVYALENNYSKALDYFLKSLTILQEKGDKYGESSIFGNIGNIYTAEKNYERAMEYYEDAIKLSDDLGDRATKVINLGNIGDVYMSENKYPQALEYYFNALKLAKQVGDKDQETTNLGNIGYVYLKTKKIELAHQVLIKALFLSDSIKTLDDTRQIELNLSGVDSALSQTAGKKGNWKIAKLYSDSALSHYKSYVADRDSIINTKNIRKQADLEADFDYQQKESLRKTSEERRTLQYQEARKRQRIITYTIAAALLLAMLFSLFVVQRLRITRRQKAIIEEQKQTVDQRNKDISDSIKYAKRLQDAILPPIAKIKKYFPDSFVLYKPKDIVAGDFYWIERIALSPLVNQGETEGSEVILIAACDCTGHGVPGALVSVVCSNALNRAVKEFNIHEPAKILDKTRELVLDTFSAGDKINDGMDISLTAIYRNTGSYRDTKIFWSGANNPLCYKPDEKNEMLEIMPDKQPIGFFPEMRPFNNHVITVPSLDGQFSGSLYLFTDGYADQFGGPKGKKYKYTPFKEKLLSISDKPMKEQKVILEQEFEMCKGEQEQTDDVCVIGIRI